MSKSYREISSSISITETDIKEAVFYFVNSIPRYVMKGKGQAVKELIKSAKIIKLIGLLCHHLYWTDLRVSRDCNIN